MNVQYRVGVLQMSNLNLDILKTEDVHYTSGGMIYQFVQCISYRNVDM